MSRSSRGDVGFGSRQRPRKFTKPEKVAMIKREINRRLISDGTLSDPSKARPKLDWHWHYKGSTQGLDLQGVLHRSNEIGGIVAANTRSEAKAQIKKNFPGGKLPKTLTITGIAPDANSPYQSGPIEISAVPCAGDSNDLRGHGENGS